MYLQEKGYRIVPVNPNETEVLGERAYPSLADVPSESGSTSSTSSGAQRTRRRSREHAVARGAKVLWLQDGIVNDDARQIAEAAGLTVIMGVCIRNARIDDWRGGS